ncbi:hypothetical protein GFB56_00305 [Ensifer sp. T173]|uniref:Uncharacterized protein n=1 Tax=Ensifer canadensis TaxID=555315 RepID=A0AAW4FE15_9HYPH|nr:hypothetical protein [Ensifer canadensis]MBM3089261.1 hypothetical protein [Ensifer canadensis]UBI76815.1 hypothetical protein J3R84_06720 [Ensifer canadensis]
MTPEERNAYNRELAKARKRKQRAEEKKTRIIAMTPELDEFVDELLSLPLQTASMALAIWQKESRQHFPRWPQPKYVTGEAQSSFTARWHRWQRFQLIRMFATDAIERDKARARKKRFERTEVQEATKLSMTTDAFRRLKRGQKLAQQMAQIAANRAA